MVDLSLLISSNYFYRQIFRYLLHEFQDVRFGQLQVLLRSLIMHNCTIHLEFEQTFALLKFLTVDKMLE